MWQIQNPAYWWGLLALAIPVIIHLYNRRQTRVKVLGTLRWLREVQPAQWNFRRIHQWTLLCIRLLLFAVIVLMLVELYRSHIPGGQAPLHVLVLIHPAAGDTNQYRQLAEGWQNDTVSVHWLAPGFPPATKPADKQDEAVWSLVAEADMRFGADSIHIIVPNRQSYFSGTPPSTTAALSWELTEVPGDSVQLIWAVRRNREPELLWFRTEAGLSEYRLQKGLSAFAPATQEVSYSADKRQVVVKKGSHTYQVPVYPPDTLIVAAQVTEALEEQWQVFQKSVQALAAYHQIPLTFAEPNDRDIDWMVNFTEEAWRPVNSQPALVFEYKPEKSAGWLERAGKNTLVIRKELTAAQVLEGGFLGALRPHLLAFAYKEAIPAQADFRQVDLEGSLRRSEKKQAFAEPEPLKRRTGNERVWLGLLALILISLERIWPKKIT